MVVQEHLEKSSVFLYRMLIALCFVFIAAAFLFNYPGEEIHRLYRICTSPCNLITDYFELAGVGATLLNVALVVLIALGVLKLNRATLTGVPLAAVLMVTSFSFFGKNPFNSLPIAPGVFLYAKLSQQEYKQVQTLVFSSGLSPLVSLIAFGFNLPWYCGIPLSYLIGILTGIVLGPFSAVCSKFHQGFSLYNTGFALGVIGLLLASVFRMIGLEIPSFSVISTATHPGIVGIISAFFLFMLIAGIRIMTIEKQYNYVELLKSSGRVVSDHVVLFGLGPTLLNMGIMGLLATGLMLLLGAPINGPVLGGIFSVAGFSAYGKHPRNALPVFAGLLAAAALHREAVNSTSVCLALLFGSALAPLAGTFGITAGVIAGYVHMAIVFNTGYLHGGMNLYNNGFTAGFVAALLVPLFEFVRDLRRRRKDEEIVE